MKDKIRDDIMYGVKASRAILSNRSYEFFGKEKDPIIATNYEGFFEIVKNQPGVLIVVITALVLIPT